MNWLIILTAYKMSGCVMPCQQTMGVTLKLKNKGKFKTLKTLKIWYVLISLKVMAKTLSEIIIFPKRGINMVYNKNINLGKSQYFWKSYCSLAMYLSIGLYVPFDRPNVLWTEFLPKFSYIAQVSKNNQVLGHFLSF